MSDAPRNPEVVELLTHVGARQLQRAPTRHRERTDQCLAISELDEALAGGLSHPQVAHVPSCVFCQKLIATAWR